MRWRRSRRGTLCGLVAMMAVAGSARSEETSPYVKVVTTRECSIVTPARTQTTTRREPGYTRSRNLYASEAESGQTHTYTGGSGYRSQSRWSPTRRSERETEVEHYSGRVVTTETNIPARKRCANRTRRFIDRRAVRRDLEQVKLPCPFVDGVNGRTVVCGGGTWVYDIEHRCGETRPRIKIERWPGSTLRKLRAERHAREAIRTADRRARRNGGVEQRIRCMLEQREKAWTARIAQRRR